MWARELKALQGALLEQSQYLINGSSAKRVVLTTRFAIGSNVVQALARDLRLNQAYRGCSHAVLLLVSRVREAGKRSEAFVLVLLHPVSSSARYPM